MIKFSVYFLLLIFSLSQAQVTGLNGWDLFIDPGHSQTQNMGINGYSEAEESLGVGLHLKQILENQTDIDTVFISRTNHTQDVSLYQRTNYANSVGASWYHSIHSDASSNSNTNKTLMLWGQLNNGNPDPPPGGEAMSSYMIDFLTEGMQIQSSGSYGDCSFYTWSDYCANSGGPYLYVNRNTNMPSELSEEGHHTNPEQNQLMMNNEYKRMVSYLLYWSILEYHEIDRPFVGQLAGIIMDTESQLPINGATISVGNSTYTTDTYESLFHNYSSNQTELRNGFYWMEGLADSTYEMIVTAPGYYSDTVSVIINSSFITFQNVQLLSDEPPIIVETNPIEGDTLFPAWDNVEIYFSRPISLESIESSIIFDPEISFSSNWGNENRMLTISPDSFEFETDYSLILLDSIFDVYGHNLDGDGDGESGGSFELTFRTGPMDMSPPEIISIYPIGNGTNIELRPIINIQFDELLNTDMDLASHFKLERFQNNSETIGQFVYYPIKNKSSICFFPESNLFENEVYVTRLYSGLMDEFLNPIISNRGFSFQTGKIDYERTIIDNLESNITDNWWGPLSSGSTTGVIADSTFMNSNTFITNLLYESDYSMEISYGWNLSGSDWLLRLYLSGGAPRQITFNSSKTMQAYVFGDGSNNKFRFCVDDNINSNNAGHEVSPWYILDWIGWKLVSWNMDEDGTGEWIGDGELDGVMRFDSFQLSYSEGQSQFGEIYIDDFRIVDEYELSVDKEIIPDELLLFGNYPNPFNPSTKIKFQLGQTRQVKITIFDLLGNQIKELTNSTFNSGTHDLLWDGTNRHGELVSSGVYIYSLVSKEINIVRRMILLK